MRYLLLLAARTRAPLVAVAATAFAAIGVYAYRPNEPHESFAVSAVLCCGLAAWLTGAVLLGEPRAQADMVTVAGRGRARPHAARRAAGGARRRGATVALVGYPLALGLFQSGVFVPAVTAGEIAAAVLGHLACGLLGGAVAVLLAPPRVVRPATRRRRGAAVLLEVAAIGAVAGPGRRRCRRSTTRARARSSRRRPAAPALAAAALAAARALGRARRLVQRAAPRGSCSAASAGSARERREARLQRPRRRGSRASPR